MTVCARPGCTAQAAARGYCTHHLGLGATKPSIVFVDDLPDKTYAPHAVEVYVAEKLTRHQPGRWARYPSEAHWPDFDDCTRQQANSRLATVTKHIRTGRDPWDTQAWEAKVRMGQLYLRRIGPTNLEAA